VIDEKPRTESGPKRTIHEDLTPREAAVVGVMRRDDMAKRAIFNYAVRFGEGGSTSGP